MDWRSREFCDRFRQGDAAALAEIYWAYVNSVEHVLSAGFLTRNKQARVPGIDEPEERGDLIQEVFLRAFSATARKNFDPGLEYRPYLLSIARNVLVDHHRKRRAKMAVSATGSDDTSAVAPAESDEQAWLSPELVQVVERYVAGLASPLRELNDLRFVRGKSQQETADSLGISRQNVRTLEERLKEGLRSALKAAREAEVSVRAALEKTAIPPRSAAGRAK